MASRKWPALIMTAALVACVFPVARAQETPDWENPQIVGQNKEPGHATLLPYPDVSTALRGTRGAVMSATRLDWKTNRIEHVCVGDIATQVVRYRSRDRFACRPGILGRRDGDHRRAVERAPLGRGDLVLACTDGLKSGIDISEDADLLREHPLVVADRLLTRYARTTDDALVLVAR